MVRVNTYLISVLVVVAAQFGQQICGISPGTYLGISLYIRLTGSVMYFSSKILSPVFQGDSKLVALFVMAIGIPFNFAPGVLPEVSSFMSYKYSYDIHQLTPSSELRHEAPAFALQHTDYTVFDPLGDWSQSASSGVVGSIGHWFCHLLQYRSGPLGMGRTFRSHAKRGADGGRISRRVCQLDHQFRSCKFANKLRSC